MTQDDIVNSEAFRAINFLIDQKAERIKNNVNSIYSRIDYLRNETDTIETRISEEQNCPVTINTDLLDLYNVADAINNLRKYEKEINDLMAYKSQLVGDWYAVKDDFTIMKTIFNDTLYKSD